MLNCKSCRCVIDTHHEFAYNKFESGLCEDCFVKKYGDLPENCHANHYDRSLRWANQNTRSKHQY